MGTDNQLFSWVRLFVLCSDTRVWTKPQVTGVSPSPRDKLASAVCNNKIYFFGGFGPKLSHSVSGNLTIYSPLFGGKFKKNV